MGISDLLNEPTVTLLNDLAHFCCTLSGIPDEHGGDAMKQHLSFKTAKTLAANDLACLEADPWKARRPTRDAAGLQGS